MCGVDAGEPISSSGLATNTRRASGSPPRASRIAAIAYRPASRPLFMSVTPGPVAMPSLIANGPLGGGARVEHRVHVADAQQRRRRPGRSPGASAMTVSPSPSSFGSVVDRRAERRAAGRPSSAPTSSTPGLRVAAAVDVDEALEVREVGGLRGLDGGAKRGQVRGREGVGDRHGRSLSSVHSPARTARTRILAGPCVWSRSACSRVPTSTGSCRWSRSRSRSGGRGPGRDRGRGTTCIVHLGRSVPARDWPDQVADLVAWTRRLRADHDEHGGPVEVHVPSDTGRWVVTWPWAGAERARLIAEAAFDLASRSVSPGPPDPAHRHPGPDRRPLAGADRRGAGDAAVMDPRRRPPDAGDLDHRHQRQVDGDPPDHPHPAARRPARRHDDLGRDPRRRADGRSRRLDRSRGRPGDPAPERRRRGRAGDRPRRPGPAWAWATSRTRRACSPTSRRTTSTSRGSTRSPSWPR